jgi:polypeptide N-acetylgalactosaminyltransferase
VQISDEIFINFFAPQIQSLANNNLCVDTMAGVYKKRQLALATCVGPLTKPKEQHQNFELTYFRDIEYEKELCFDANTWSTEQFSILLVDCHFTQTNQFWKYDREKKMIYKDKAGTICMDCDTLTKDIFISKCNETNINQKWKWGFVNDTMMADWLANGSPLL